MKPGDLFLLKNDTHPGLVRSVWNDRLGGRIIMFIRRINLDESCATSEFLIEGRTEFFNDEVMKRWAEPLLDVE